MAVVLVHKSHRPIEAIPMETFTRICIQREYSIKNIQIRFCWTHLFAPPVRIHCKFNSIQWNNEKTVWNRATPFQFGSLILESINIWFERAFILIIEFVAVWWWILSSLATQIVWIQVCTLDSFPWSKSPHISVTACNDDDILAEFSLRFVYFFTHHFHPRSCCCIFPLIYFYAIHH